MAQEDKDIYSELGTVTFTVSNEKITEWLIAGSKDWSQEVMKNYSSGDHHNFLENDFRKIATKQEFNPNDASSTKEMAERFTAMTEYADRFSQEIKYLYTDDTFTVIAFGKLRYALPTDFVTLRPYKDYASISAGELSALSSGNGFLNDIEKDLASIDSLSATTAKVEEKAIELDSLKQEADSVRRGTNAALADLNEQIEKLKAEMEARKSELLAELNRKMVEAEDMMMSCEKQLFQLDSTIYAIRCYTGEVISFTGLRIGKPESQETPIVLFQKLRFLDEEMGRLTSLYDFNGSDYKLFEEFIASRDDVFEEFCPSKRCVTLLKISKDAKYFARNTSRFGEDVNKNMLKAYDVFHGGQIAILVRDGENLYCGWTEEDRITFDDNAFFVPGVTVEQGEPEERESWQSAPSKRSLFEQAMEKAKEFASRYYLFTILQGICDHITPDKSPLVRLPEEALPVNILKSDYFIFSAAENWLADNPYGTLSEIHERVNAKTRKGDMILSLLNITPRPWSTNYQSAHNDRGRGYAVRTQDIRLEDDTVYRVNLTEYGEPYKLIHYQSGSTEYTITCNPGCEPSLREGTKILSSEICKDMHYYISLEKQESTCGARSNCEIFPTEFINLSYLNSRWLLNIIQSKNLGDWTVGEYGTAPNYSYAIRYLNHALQFVKEREVEEARLIRMCYPELDNNSEWPALLSEWKLEHTVSNITDYQAKRFAKALSEGYGNTK